MSEGAVPSLEWQRAQPVASHPHPAQSIQPVLILIAITITIATAAP
jgi:hypothetical protein